MTKHLILDNSRVSPFKSQHRLDEWHIARGKNGWEVWHEKKCAVHAFTRTTYQLPDEWRSLPDEVQAAVKKMHGELTAKRCMSNATINGQRG